MPTYINLAFLTALAFSWDASGIYLKLWSYDKWIGFNSGTP